MGKEMTLEDLMHDCRKQNSLLHSAVASLMRQNQQKDVEIERLNQILLNMQRARFGQSSEKRAYILGDSTEQITLFDPPESDVQESLLAYYRAARTLRA